MKSIVFKHFGHWIKVPRCIPIQVFIKKNLLVIYNYEKVSWRKHINWKLKTKKPGELHT